MCTFGVPADKIDADGLPNLSNAITDRSVIEAAITKSRAALLSAGARVTRITAGPGFGRAWTGTRESYKIVTVSDWAINVHLRSTGDCPRDKDPTKFAVDDVPAFYVGG